MFLEQQISILEWFLKDHETLKTEVMAAKNAALPSQEKKKTVRFKILLQIEKSYINNISQIHYCFTVLCITVLLIN